MDTNDYISHIFSHYHRKVQRDECRSLGDVSVESNTFEFIGQLPLLIPIISKLGIKDIVDGFCPVEREHPEFLSHGEVVEILVYNRLLSPRPLYRVDEWALANGIEAVFGIDPMKLNDDRIGRTLEAVAEKMEEIQGALSLKMMKEFDISADIVHYDITSLSFEGNYNESEMVKFGYNRDKRPDLKQVNLSLDVTRDGAVPVWSSVLEGNKSDVRTVVGNMKKLQQHVKTKDCVAIMDRGMVSGDNLYTLMKKGAGFIAAMPLRGNVQDIILSTSDEKYVDVDYAGRSGEDKIKAAPCSILMKTNKVKKDGGVISFNLHGFIYDSSRKKKRDKSSRNKGIEKMNGVFQDVGSKLNTRKYKKRDYVAAMIGKHTGRKKARAFFNWELSGEDGSLHLEYQIDEESLGKAEVLDGKYIIVTDDESRSADEVLKSYKSQHLVEWRFRNLKSNLKVTPVFLKKDIRIAGLVFTTIISLMAYSLLEHLCRKAQLGITAFLLFERFGVCIFSRMKFSNGQTLYVAGDPNTFQRKILDALGFPYPRDYI